jgi:hypothetical protein
MVFALAPPRRLRRSLFPLTRQLPFELGNMSPKVRTRIRLPAGVSAVKGQVDPPQPAQSQ